MKDSLENGMNSTKINETIRQKLSELNATDKGIHRPKTREESLSDMLKLNDEVTSKQYVIENQSQIIDRLQSELTKLQHFEQLANELQEQYKQQDTAIKQLQDKNQKLKDKEQKAQDLIKELQTTFEQKQEQHINDMVNQTNLNLQNFIAKIQNKNEVNLQESDILQVKLNLTQLQQKLQNQQKVFLQRQKEIEDRCQGYLEESIKYQEMAIQKQKEYANLQQQFVSKKTAANSNNMDELFFSQFRDEISKAQQQQLDLNNNTDNYYHALAILKQMQDKNAQNDEQIRNEQFNLNEIQNRISAMKQRNEQLKSDMSVQNLQLESIQKVQQQLSDSQLKLNNIAPRQPTDDTALQENYYGVPIPQLNSYQQQQLDSQKDLIIKGLQDEIEQRQNQINQLNISMQQSIRPEFRYDSDISKLRDKIEAKLALDERLADRSIELTLLQQDQ